MLDLNSFTIGWSKNGKVVFHACHCSSVVLNIFLSMLNKSDVKLYCVQVETSALPSISRTICAALPSSLLLV